jgi:formylglycine-generating enzyme required for sulfatase activity
MNNRKFVATTLTILLTSTTVLASTIAERDGETAQPIRHGQWPLKSTVAATGETDAKRCASERTKKKDKAGATASKQSVLKPEMIKIKGGCFTMGSQNIDFEEGFDERQHKVCVDDFQIGKYEVTQAQWQAVMGNNTSIFQGENLPVENVTWSLAHDYLDKLKAKTGQEYRLPTEAEWEYAARAGTTTPYYTGACIKSEQANYNGFYTTEDCDNNSPVHLEKTSAVGSFPANPWGLHDMAGNVSEWTCSKYQKDYDDVMEKECRSALDPISPRAARGGSFTSEPLDLRSSDRLNFAPDYHDVAVGFRLVKK